MIRLDGNGLMSLGVILNLIFDMTWEAPPPHQKYDEMITVGNRNVSVSDANGSCFAVRDEDERSTLAVAEGLSPTVRFEMCDYSLRSIKSRPAKVGDKLITRDFGTGTQGFAASEDRSVAVCVLPGTELSFSQDVTCLATGLL
ncbi:MAG: hypothetical protein WAL37_04640, partial [Xanthobacteraceae bacterium]